ncbi:hypothetical protein ACFL96_12400, partial [Thermoproteota archaeon]
MKKIPMPIIIVCVILLVLFLIGRSGCCPLMRSIQERGEARKAMQEETQQAKLGEGVYDFTLQN